MAIESLSHRVPPSSDSTMSQNGSSTRTPSVLTAGAAPTTTKPTPLVRVKVRSAQSVRRTYNRGQNVELNTQLRQERNKFDKAVVELGKKYHKSSVQVRARALLTNKYGITKRRVNTFNAFRRMQSKNRSTFYSVCRGCAC
jgi:hypothetical protein